MVPSLMYACVCGGYLEVSVTRFLVNPLACRREESVVQEFISCDRSHSLHPTGDNQYPSLLDTVSD